MKNKKGQALVEFVIILPVLIMILFGAVDFGRIILRQNELEGLTNDIVNLYNEGKSYSELLDFLKENNSSNTLSVTNKDNTYIEFSLESEVVFITPGLGKILGEPYYAKVTRVIYYE